MPVNKIRYSLHFEQHSIVLPFLDLMDFVCLHNVNLDPAGEDRGVGQDTINSNLIKDLK